MPVYKKINPNSKTSVKIWKITESFEDLMASLSLKDDTKKRVLGMKSEIHQRGFLSVRKLLAEFGYTDMDLFYDDCGRPHLKDGKNISISHSFNFSAVIISEDECGIDIEKQRKKIKVIAPKFIDYELDYLKDTRADLINKLTIIWCVKESLYKLYCQPGLSFKNHCLVIPFDMKDGNTLAWIDYENKKSRYAIEFLEFEGFSCAYAVA